MLEIVMSGLYTDGTWFVMHQRRRAAEAEVEQQALNPYQPGRCVNFQDGGTPNKTADASNKH